MQKVRVLQITGKVKTSKVKAERRGRNKEEENDKEKDNEKDEVKMSVEHM